jgi:succinate dehydrogenase / fumarate reductase flavoprotein subunit
MQGLADGYFVAPYTVGEYLAGKKFEDVDGSHPAVSEAVSGVEQLTSRLLGINGSRTVDSLHRELGMIMLDKCGMSRTKEGLAEAIGQIRELRDEFWSDVKVPGEGKDVNQELEKAGRVADFFELAELMCIDASQREESCGGHFREEYQTDEGEALRNDEEFCNVTVWENTGDPSHPKRHVEELEFDVVELATRSYK